MKKFLVILLLSFIACQVIREKPKVKKLSSRYWEDQFQYIVEDAIKWLNRNEHLKEIKGYLDEGDEVLAMAICIKYFNEKICKEALEKIKNM